MLTIHRVMEPKNLWENFFASWGEKMMVDAYGWGSAPDAARWGEQVFAFREGTVTVGWTSLTAYPKDETVLELAIGIWPNHQGKGHRRPMLRLTAEKAFVDPLIDTVTMLVLDSVPRHSQQCMRDAENGGDWIFAGRIWFPDPLRVFTLSRAAHESSLR